MEAAVQRINEGVPCALCHMPAERRALHQSTDGYLYDCPACGGRYSIGITAAKRAAKGEAPIGLLADLRHRIANGELPRVEYTAGEWQPLKPVGHQAEP